MLVPLAQVGGYPPIFLFVGLIALAIVGMTVMLAARALRPKKVCPHCGKRV
jgi:hypothetical protein